ncbi:hypothetical protein EI94DRAFT_1709000 [Lactarius quietus]|nr:hypothetical protein EI94DRAFT_1709000 [Lactarius quietus]
MSHYQGTSPWDIRLTFFYHPPCREMFLKETKVVQSQKMSSAFRKGVLLLKELDSDGSWCWESTVTFSGPSSDAGGINEVPKNVTLLEPVIGRLMDKDYPRLLLPNGFQGPERELYGFKGIR